MFYIKLAYKMGELLVEEEEKVAIQEKSGISLVAGFIKDFFSNDKKTKE